MVCCVNVCWASKAKNDVESNRSAVFSEFSAEEVGVLVIEVYMECITKGSETMSSSETGGATVIHVDDGKTATTSAVQQRKGGGIPFLLRSGAEGLRRCMALVDFMLRVAAFGAALAAAIATGTSDETLSVFTQLFQFHARFDDFPAFTFSMVGNAVAAGYLVLSLPFSGVMVARPKATGVRLLLLVCDTLMVAVLTAAAAAAAAMVYVAHSGNLRANWVPICMQFHGFCQRTSGAVVASFLADLLLLALAAMGACAIRGR